MAAAAAGNGMIGSCSTAADAPLVAGLLGTVDCTADGLLAGGYAALAAPDGPVAAAITGALTLFVGFYAYRLLLGRTTLNANEALLGMVKIGLVLVLAGNWAIYQQVVARTLFEAPQALADLVLGSFDRRGSLLSAVPLDALQQVFDEMIRDVRSLSSHAGDRSPLLGGPSFATMMLNASAYATVFSSAGVLAATRIGLALLLALGPVVAGFLLFNGTRGLVEGWLRAMIALAVVSLTTVVLLSVELLVLEPSLVMLARERAGDAILPETAMKVSFIVAIFAMAKLGAMISALTLARGLRLPTPQAGRADAVTPAAMSAAVAAATQQGRDAVPARVARIAAAADPGDRQNTSFRSGAAQGLQTSLSAADRYRQAGSAAVAAAPDIAHHPHRAVRPRRELLVARRKR